MLMPSTRSAIAWSTILAWRTASCRLSNTRKCASGCALSLTEHEKADLIEYLKSI
jgi:hypothetical protein